MKAVSSLPVSVMSQTAPHISSPLVPFVSIYICIYVLYMRRSIIAGSPNAIVTSDLSCGTSHRRGCEKW